MTVIIGIDPGLLHTGWGVIEKRGNSLSFVACGRISTNAKQGIASRLCRIHEGLQDICELYRPDVAALEETFVNVNSASSLKLANARGAILLSLSLAGLSIYEYSSRHVKKTVTGSGRADKEQIASMVQVLLPACRHGEDVATRNSADAMDALAIAITHAHNGDLF